MHFNKIRKQDAWEEQGKEVNRPVDERKKKMENLLSSLRREKMKMRKSSGTGKGEYFYLNYRVIHKSLGDFRTRLRNIQDRHGRKEHINR